MLEWLEVPAALGKPLPEAVESTRNESQVFPSCPKSETPNLGRWKPRGVWVSQLSQVVPSKKKGGLALKQAKTVP